MSFPRNLCLFLLRTSTGVRSDAEDRSTKGSRGRKPCRFLWICNFATRPDCVASRILGDRSASLIPSCIYQWNFRQYKHLETLVAWVFHNLSIEFRKLTFRWAHRSRLSRGCIDKYLSCLQHSNCFFCLDLEKGCAALLNTSHRRPESTLWSNLQEVSRCANSGVANWRSLQDFSTCWKGGFAGNSFEQFWTTACLWTSVSNLSQNDKSTEKWCGLSLSFETVQHHFDHVLYPSHPVRQVHAPTVQTEVPKEAEAKNNAGFSLKFRYTTRSCSFKKLRWLVWRL